MDAFARAFLMQCVHETDQRQFRRAVIGLAKIAIKAGGRSRHHDAAILTLTHVVPHRLGAVDASGQVDIHDELEIFQAHFVKAFIAQNTGIVDQNIDMAPFLDGVGDHFFDRWHIGDAAPCCHGYAALSLDFSDHLFGNRGRTASAVTRAAKVSDDNLHAAARQFHRMFLAKPGASARDNGYAIVKFYFAHRIFASRFLLWDEIFAAMDGQSSRSSQAAVMTLSGFGRQDNRAAASLYFTRPLPAVTEAIVRCVWGFFDRPGKNLTKPCYASSKRCRLPRQMTGSSPPPRSSDLAIFRTRDIIYQPREEHPSHCKQMQRTGIAGYCSS